MNRDLLALALLPAALAGCHGGVRPVEPEPASIQTTLFLVGDAGAPDPRLRLGPPLDSLARQAAVAPERSLILFLGDNVYPDGVQPLGAREEGAAERADARRRLRAQIDAVPPGARAIFLPGNHDWAGGGVFGLNSVRLEQGMLRSLATGRDIQMLPGEGCPGPVAVDTGRLRVVVLDTEWWLHEYIVHDERSGCTLDPGAVTRRLRAVVVPHRDDQVTVVAGHHPLMTGGPHGGYCGATAPFHRFGGRSQDIISRANRTMRDSIESAFSEHAPLVYAAGHEHVLQVLRGGRTVPYLLVSGAGSKTSCAVWMRESYYVAQNSLGFMRLDILKPRGVLLRVYRYDRHGVGGLAYTRWLEARE